MLQAVALLLPDLQENITRVFLSGFSLPYLLKNSSFGMSFNTVIKSPTTNYGFLKKKTKSEVHITWYVNT